MKESQSSTNNSAQPPTTANQNLPQSGTPPSSGKQASEENQKREELNNYEVSSKTTTTVSSGYAIDRLSVAVVINRSVLMQSLGDKPSADALDKKLADIEQIIATAAGVDRVRGDTIKVLAADFVDSGRDLEPVPSPGIMDAVFRQSGTLINAAVILAITAVVVIFVVRPLIRALATPAAEAFPVSADPLMLQDSMAPPLTLGEGMEPGAMQIDGWTEENLIEDVTSRPRRSPQKRLEQMIEFDEEQAAAVLKQWIHQRVAA